MNNPMLFTESAVNHIREQSVGIDRTGLISQDMLETIYKHGLFKCFLPDFLNGSMTPLPQALRLFEDASRIDGNFGWIVTIGNRGTYFATYVESDKLPELFSGRTAVLAGSGFSSGTAKRVAGGYELSGSWRYCSGSTHATVFALNSETSVDGNPAMTEIRTFLLQPNQVTISKDWNAFGLRGTSSHSVEVKNQFVADSMSFIASGDNQTLHDDIYLYPYKSFSELSFAAVVIGLVLHFMDEANALAQRNREAWETSHLNRYEFVMDRIERKQKILNATVDNFYRLAESNWDKHVQKKEIAREEWELIGKTCRRVSRVALDCVHALFPYLGTSVVLEHNSINRIYRDLHTACQNALLVPFNEEEFTY